MFGELFGETGRTHSSAERRMHAIQIAWITLVNEVRDNDAASPYLR
jgi:hypothetical protein